MQVHLDNLILLGEKGLRAEDLQREERRIPDFLRQIARWKQGFTTLPKLKGPVLAVKELAQKFNGAQDVVVLGIGGSALGVACLRDALKGSLWNHHGLPRLFVVDNLDTLPEIEKVVDIEKALFVVISKSGITPETMAQYFYFKEKVSKEQFIFITDAEEGELRAIGKEYKIPMLEIPENVGGRFSVLSAVGLFPAALLGVDIEELLKGAERMAALFQKEDWELNLPFQFATVQYLLEFKQGISNTVFLPYSSRLASLGAWYAQLLSESIGKEGKGLNPIAAIGVSDQHSQLQLWTEGPKDKLVIFVEVEKEKSPMIPRVSRKSLAYLGGRPFHELMNLEKRGTEQALTEYGRPNLTIRIPEVSAFELGQLFMFLECSIAFLGEYYRINAFDQPGVELSKKLTRKLLTS